MKAKSIGQQLKRSREKKQLTQVQLAVMAGMSPATISMLENESLNKVQLPTLEKLAKALGITFEISGNGSSVI